jgi:hypothetical protein
MILNRLKTFITCSQMPMSLTLRGTGRLKYVKNFRASNRSSKMLLMRAKNGARGKATTKSVQKLKLMYVRLKLSLLDHLCMLTHIVKPFLNTRETTPLSSNR